MGFMCREEVIKEFDVIHLSIVRSLTVNVKPLDPRFHNLLPPLFYSKAMWHQFSWHKVIIMSKAKGKENLVPLPQIF